ncbi:hypothetical protein [Actinokineospora sp. NBRC 105648]|uniref:hypothetical protein n=1 Tax=Actinokineospora sp. NBRC 105648 TaxID=3032206 RepID=UPI0024A0FFFE|nr:hypothetical protein [Actinokineospora sp. NBRC 105648]GLZ38285.1 hypothetical protein Acsp05_19090 [Actinokineospora sp. NBRC 105648]
MKGHIWFPGNPWPEGHRVDDFSWSGRQGADGGLWFDLELATADYDETRNPPDTEDTGDWASPIVWTNYHSCMISSTNWGNAIGFPAGDFQFDRPQRLTADTVPNREDPAFHTYLLGHDAVAHHEFEFQPTAAGRWDIVWTGKIALAYIGDEEFKYSFRAELDDVEYQPPS